MNRFLQFVSETPLSVIILLLGTGILVGTLQPELGGDGDARLEILEAILGGSQLPKSKYPIIQPLLSIPLAAIGSLFGFRTFEAAKYFNTSVLLCLGSLVYWKIKARIDSTYAAEFCIFSLAASMLHVNVSLYYGEVLTAFCLLLGFLVLDSQRVLAALLVAIGVANTPAIGPPVLIAAIAFRAKSWPILTGLALAFLIFCTETYLKFGGLFDSEYLTQSEKGLKTILPYSGLPGFSYPMFFGVVSILFSFGKGLLFFIPSLVLICKREVSSLFEADSRKKLCVFLFSIALILVYSKWWAWYGGVFWGPRFFLSLVFVGSYLFLDELDKDQNLLGKLVLAAILMLSTWVGLASMAFRDYDIAPICEANGYMYESLCWYVPEFSPLWRPFVELGLVGVLERLLDHRYHSFAIWQVVVFFYFLHKIFLADPENRRGARIEVAP